jgi:hypothetical protein
MNMFWNRKLSREWGSGAIVHMLRAATIAAVVSSCSTSPPEDPAVLANVEEPPPPPLVMRLDPTSLLAEGVKDYAWKAYQDLPTEEKSARQDLLNDESQLQNVYVTILYIDENSQERLLSLAPSVPNPNNTTWQVNQDAFRIPKPPGPDTHRKFTFREATVHEVGSPATSTYCWRGGGSNYCSF